MLPCFCWFFWGKSKNSTVFLCDFFFGIYLWIFRVFGKQVLSIFGRFSFCRSDASKCDTLNKSKITQKSLYRSKSFDLTHAQNSGISRKWKTFSSLTEYLKSTSLHTDKPPAYELAMDISYSTKTLPPCYLMTILKHQFNTNVSKQTPRTCTI